MNLDNATIGRGGLIDAAKKREGDGCTPMGVYHLREIWFRPDRVQGLNSRLSQREITKDDCWCDDPKHPFYNKHFKLAEVVGMESFEHLYRDDHAYDIIVVVGYNDAPTVPGKGSAIFIHCEHDDKRPTAGCVALPKQKLFELCAGLTPESKMAITKEGIWIS